VKEMNGAGTQPDCAGSRSSERTWY
jgi:hypothetical protein